MESATYGEVLDRALDRSENALTENLVRQAAAAAGRPTTPQGANAAYIRGAPRGARRADRGTRAQGRERAEPRSAASAATLSGVLRLAATGQVEELRASSAACRCRGCPAPCGGRFGSEATDDVAGCPGQDRDAAQGLLAGGHDGDADGRPLTFVVLVDEFPETYGGTQRARAALDRIVAALTRCGCR